MNDARPADSLEPDRRPVRSRDSRLAHRVTAWLVARRVSPDAISVVGLIAGVLAGAVLAATSHWPDLARAAWLAAAVLMQVRLLCNLFDGMVAIAGGRTSPVGELYNEIPDRVSDSAILIGLGFAAGGVPWLGGAAALLAMATAYVRAVGKAAGVGSDFGGPMAKPQRMFVVTVLALILGLGPAVWQGTPGETGAAAWAAGLIAVGSLTTALLRLRRIARRLAAGAA